MGENHFARAADRALRRRAADGGDRLLHPAAARSSPRRARIRCWRSAVGSDWKGKLSPVLYLIAILVAFWLALGSKAIYVLVALMWLIPDRRIEKVLARKED